MEGVTADIVQIGIRPQFLAALSLAPLCDSRTERRGNAASAIGFVDIYALQEGDGRGLASIDIVVTDAGFSKACDLCRCDADDECDSVVAYPGLSEFGQMIIGRGVRPSIARS